jgi:hypothetical protein
MTKGEDYDLALFSMMKPSLQPNPPPKRKVQRHSPHRLLRKKLFLPGGVTVSAERHRGRLVVRVEVPDQ